MEDDMAGKMSVDPETICSHLKNTSSKAHFKKGGWINCDIQNIQIQYPKEY